MQGSVTSANYGSNIVIINFSEAENLKVTKSNRFLSVFICVVLMGLIAGAQTAYQPKFKGDPARSDSEAHALGYMRTFLRAQRIYKKKNNHYATSLLELAHTGSFTRRMVSTDREDYMVKFTPHKEKDTFEIRMLPKQPDATRRSFFAKEDGVIRASEQGEADEHSPVLKAD
jgi:hypothetical protein